MSQISDAIQTRKSFGDKWKSESHHFGVRGNDDDYKYFKKIFHLLLNTENLEDIFKDGINSLNAGCGVAWCEYLFNVNPKSNRFAVDISTSVVQARKFTKHLDNITVLQADMLDLPFKSNFFDVIFADGCIHHTVNPKRCFDSLCSHLKPGGLIAIYIYCVKPFIRENIDRLLRELTTRMTFDECAEFSRHIATLGKSLNEVKGDIIVNEDIPILGIKKGKYGVQEFIYKHVIKCWYNESLGYDTSVMVNVDWYHPKYASHHTKEEVIQWFSENNIRDVNFRQPKEWEHSGYFVSGRKGINEKSS